ncbi:hypothetical protein SBOR_7929 [Sclerotinia borealis F-4128]|uniref:Uncharacterized protein n=1 Tax=Sclerotinia borealis (strain F-4128) TaxID=1432307 RepID=W9C4I0_SCLBF|nr:hypothetical protein SBOR_7929 [Sclerotinia borealis F-4128]
MTPEGSIRLQQCHLLNRTVIKRFMIQRPDGEQRFFGFQSPSKFRITLSVLSYAESMLCLDIYPNESEYTELGPAACIELVPIQPNRYSRRKDASECPGDLVEGYEAA